MANSFPSGPLQYIVKTRVFASFSWSVDLTGIFIAPGHRFRVVGGLVTNFHVPRSSLLMLVSAFAGIAPVRRASEEAVRSRYRFYSYGDAMAIL